MWALFLIKLFVPTCVFCFHGEYCMKCCIQCRFGPALLGKLFNFSLKFIFVLYFVFNVAFKRFHIQHFKIATFKYSYQVSIKLRKSLYQHVPWFIHWISLLSRLLPLNRRLWARPVPSYFTKRFVEEQYWIDAKMPICAPVEKGEGRGRVKERTSDQG